MPKKVRIRTKVGTLEKGDEDSDDSTKKEDEVAGAGEKVVFVNEAKEIVRCKICHTIRPYRKPARIDENESDDNENSDEMEEMAPLDEADDEIDRMIDHEVQLRHEQEQQLVEVGH